MDPTCKARSDNIFKGMIETQKSSERNSECNKIRTRRKRLETDWKDHVKRKNKKNNLPRRKQAQSHLMEDREATAPSGKRSTHLDTTAFFMDKDPTRELTVYCERLFKSKEEDIATAMPAVRAWKNS